MTTRGNAALTAWSVLAVLALAFGAGCDTRPGPLKTANNKAVDPLPVDENDAQEVALVAAVQESGATYQSALGALQAFYYRTGALTKQEWTEQEANNLKQAQWFKFGVVAAPAPNQAVEGPNEAGLVEQVVGARHAWMNALEKLAEYYETKGLTFKAKVIKRVQERFDPIRTYDYFTNAEVPPPSLKPTEVVPEADTLFEKALKLHRQGKPLPLITSYRKERQALLLFHQLVDQYPTSTKIAHAAYHIAEIYKEYFNEDARAVIWYERAWQWDPHIQLPARSHAAYVYDFRLGQHGKALALYHEVIKYEQFDASNIRYAHQRIRELTEQK